MATHRSTPVVIPSTEVGANQEDTITVTKRLRKHKKQTSSNISDPDCKSPGSGGPAQASCHDDDPMTPPDMLLKLLLDRCRDFTNSRHEDALDGWIRCTALARIVHGDTNWVLAMTHVQLGLEYMRRGLNEQAMLHAFKGQDILQFPTSHVTSHDAPPEAVYNLALAHYIIGHAQIVQRKLKEAERSLLKAEKSSKCYSQLSTDDEGTQLELDIMTDIGRLRLDQGNYTSAKDYFQKAIDLSKTSYGSQNGHLVILLRGLASAVLRGEGDKATAVHTLEEAVQIAESNFGANSEEVGDSLLSLARAHIQDGPAETVEDYFQRAHSVYVCAHDQYHQKAIGCKDEMCRYLATKSESQKTAIPLLRELITEKRATYGENSVEVGESLKLLGTVYLTQGDIKEATKSLSKAKAVYTATIGAKHKETMSIVRTLDIIAGSGESRTKIPVFKTAV